MFNCMTPVKQMHKGLYFIVTKMTLTIYHNAIFVPKVLKLKNIQKVIRKQITPKCQSKWDTLYEKKFNWISIWYIY
jgi:hypothetical protein